MLRDSVEKNLISERPSAQPLQRAAQFNGVVQSQEQSMNLRTRQRLGRVISRLHSDKFATNIILRAHWLVITVSVIAALVSLVQIIRPVEAAPGDLDPSFGQGGKVFHQGVPGVQSMVLQPDGKILTVAGTGMIRYNPDGSLDETFGINGFASTIFLYQGVGPQNGYVNHIVVQPDGKIVGCGTMFAPNLQSDFMIARFNSNGSVDTTFGTGGVNYVNFTAKSEGAGSLAMQPDGKFVLGGGNSYVVGGPGALGFEGDGMVVRFNSDGTLDTSFGLGGRQMVPWTNGRDAIKGVAISSSGKIVLGGNTGQRTLGVARLNADGSFDSTFGSGGKATGSQIFDVNAFLYQPDGKIVLVGTGDSYLFMKVARFNSEGTTDFGFGSGGTATTTIRTVNYAYDAGLQADGKIVVVGETLNWDQSSDMAVLRFDSSGNLDPSFGDGGKSIIDFFGYTDTAWSVAIQPDGRILVGGSSLENPNSGGVSMARYLGDVVPQSISGRVTGNNGEALPGVTLTLSGSQTGNTQTDANGDYVFNGIVPGGDYTVTPSLAGQSFFPASRTFNDLSGNQVADFTTLVPTPTPTPTPSPTPTPGPHPDGNLDLTFGAGGRVTTDFFSSIDSVAGISVQPDGKIVVAGTVFNSSTYDFAIARYLSDGSLDSSFGSGGKVVTDLFGSNDFGNALVIQPDGKIIVAGSTYRSGTVEDFALARYQSNGTLDSSFGSGGKVATDFFNDCDEVVALMLQPDGKIIAAGGAYGGTSFSLSTSNDIAVARYNADGSLDSSFGFAGKVNTDFSRGYDVGSGVAVQADGKIVVSGTQYVTSTSADFLLVRYGTNGALDQSFGSNGRVMTDFSGGSDVALDVVVQPDGRIIVAGSAFITATKSDFALARYNLNGSLDTSFGANGRVTTDFTGDHERGYAVALQSDGKIVVAGQSFSGGTSADFALARYLSSGGLDYNFGLLGRLTTDFSSLSNDAFALAIQSDGKIVLAGRAFSNNADYNFALARYLGGTPGPPGSGQTFAITGRITNNTGAPIAALLVSLSGSEMLTTQTDGNGNYGFAALGAGGNYRVEPSPASFTFDRASQYFFGLDGNKTANFIGFAQSPGPTPTPTPLTATMALINLDATGLNPAAFNLTERRFVLQVKNVNWATLPPDIPLNLKDSQGNVIRAIVLPGNGQAWSAVLDLSPGTYTLVRADNPSIVSTITVP
jgi:uncharacterized delta-60 repeat protein